MGKTEIELPLLVAEEEDGLAVDVAGRQPRSTGEGDRLGSSRSCSRGKLAVL